jgi:hypothetical protein
MESEKRHRPMAADLTTVENLEDITNGTSEKKPGYEKIRFWKTSETRWLRILLD